MANYYTTMSDLLTAIKNTLLTYQTSTLSSVKTYKRGVLPPVPVFPAVAILPVSETFGKPRSNKIVPVYREVLIEVYTKHLNQDTQVSQNYDITEAIRNILKYDLRLVDGNTDKSSFDIFVDVSSYGDIQYSNSIIRRSSFSVKVSSYETLPTSINNTTISEETSKNILTVLHSKIAAYTFTDNIAHIKKEVMPPTPTFPSIYVYTDKEEQDRFGAGLDSINRNFIITVVQKQLPKEQLLNTLFRIVDNLKVLLWTNNRLDNTLRYSYIDSIEYNSMGSANNMMYGADINFITFGYDELSFNLE